MLPAGDPPRSGPAAAGPEGAAELADAPPFLTWRGIHLIVLAALAAEIAVALAVTALYR